jgi:hypothetical protein
MMLYLKFWESDMYQRLLHQFALLANGLPFDWHFVLDNRDTVTPMIERARKNLSRNAPLMSGLLKTLYSSILRNCIAHSQYYFADTIVLLDEQGELKKTVSFSEWRGIITKTLLLHNGLEVLQKRVLDDYREQSKNNQGNIEVRVTNRDQSTRFEFLSPMQNRIFWVWSNNLIESGLAPMP